MQNNARVTVGFGGDGAIDVKCVICFAEPVSAFRFSLSTLMKIDGITADGVSWRDVREWQPRWSFACREYEVTGEFRELIIEYHGRVEGWCNIVEDRRIALSSYSAWTITETSEPVEFTFIPEGLEDYFVLINSADIGNIIALKNGCYHKTESSGFNFYYLNESDKIYADAYARYYDEILRYYASIFAPKPIEKMDMVCLGLAESNGAYFRKELIVFDALSPTDDAEKVKRNALFFLPHELGHNWFTGADTSTWEDWLNETGAEWSSLLFALSIGETEFFEQSVQSSIKRSRDYPPIKMADGSRPDGVHVVGTALFYKIYTAYGADTIIAVLKVLAELESKTTAAFLTAVEEKIGKEIAALIGRGITEQQ
ncbi:MAG: hypothetical protein LBN00_00340 [Oscillospiraceae bacterium]|jgi:hypothetical protein|nr:hypothetical protein [Oscillospiraceae bacterium]